ncbi:hypothetical protein [Glutamicibacter sp. TV12E]|uniref:hypothetical protein n=1 Tax=Glutamicibacter sp. TV12E TaxID=3446362 RepID=UPI004034C7C2
MSECTVTCDCKVARHEHGQRIMYVVHKCRGSACREAARVYEAKRQRQRLYGIEADRVDAQPVREHVLYLKEHGVSYKALAKASGVSSSAITAMLFGRAERGHAPYSRVTRETAVKILAVNPTMDNMSAGRPIDATGTHRRLQALVAIGYSIASLGDRLDITSSNMTSLMHRDRVVVSTARKVRSLYSELWDKPNAASEWRQLSAANRARNFATIHGWLPPMAWDDDQIDDPDHQPVMNVPKGNKVEANREAFVEEVEFFADCGDGIESIATTLDVSPDAVEKRLVRYERTDLLDKIGRAPKRPYERRAAS